MFAIQAQRAGTKNQPSPEGLWVRKPGGRAPEVRHPIARLDHVRKISHNLGYGVGDYMDGLLSDHAGI